MRGGHWLVSLVAPDADAAAAAMTALDVALDAVSAFEDGAGAAWRVDGLSLARPDRARLETLLALAWAGRGGEPPALAVEYVATRDWAAENQASFPPLRVGRYFIRGSQVAMRAPAGRIGLVIDAATAFGTGEHGSTRGCLLALDALARRRRRSRVLDMGTGTGILAMAAAKTWHVKVRARDIDAEAVRVARRNATANGVARRLLVRRGAGYGDRDLLRHAPYDLVLANILARPLIAMSRGLARALADGGVAVVAGLLARHVAGVLAAHRRVGLVLVRRIAVDNWQTLVLARGFIDRDGADP
ncbi:MAG TPA: 50S ribosomal protein L11 methyltransferase [Stellaceae bacterium]|nr:50S ribosomal protein L11 methyltransferase [Stellaceae bacterium]